MKEKKRFVIILVAAALLAASMAGLYWGMRNYILVEFRFYPRNEQQLDLRGQELTVRRYEKLARRLPDCEILWDVPFREERLPSTAEEITVTELSEADIPVLAYFPGLKTVQAEACTDYDTLLKLRAARPDLQLNYAVGLGGEKFSGIAERIALTDIREEEIPLLAYLPQLRSIVCGGGEKEALSALGQYCLEHALELHILLGETVIPSDTREVTADGITEQQLQLLTLLPQLQALHIRQPEITPEQLTALGESCPDVKITWDREVFGTVYSSDTREFDFSGVKITDLEALDREMDYFPDAETVFLGECGLDNEVLAAHREQARDRYKLVWTVTCGSKLKTRTDATTFMPVREHVYYFNDQEAYNLRYCEDMVCIDIGHMSIHNIEFVKFMPNLQYLILAHTQLQYIEPIRTCKNLKFLELDWSPLRDLSPLKDCTALEDLNLGNTFADFTPIGEMTWLKNLWMVDCSTGARYQMTQALPNTRVVVSGDATVAGGWRNLENYYEMRDLLGMYYMSW